LEFAAKSTAGDTIRVFIIIVGNVWEVVGDTFALEGVFVKDFKETAGTFTVIIQFSIQARALDAAKGKGVVDEAFVGTSTVTIIENRSTKGGVTSNTSVIVKDKIFIFVTSAVTSVYVEDSTILTVTDIIEEETEEWIFNVTSDTFVDACNRFDVTAVTDTFIAIVIKNKEIVTVTCAFFCGFIEVQSVDTQVTGIIISQEVVGHTFT
jgi:hypothetical protein